MGMRFYLHPTDYLVLKLFFFAGPCPFSLFFLSLVTATSVWTVDCFVFSFCLLFLLFVCFFVFFC